MPVGNAKASIRSDHRRRSATSRRLCGRMTEAGGSDGGCSHRAGSRISVVRAETAWPVEAAIMKVCGMTVLTHISPFSHLVLLQ